MKRCIEIFAVFYMISAILSLAEGGGSAAAQLNQYVTDPLEEPMSTAPSVNQTTVMILKNSKLIEIGLLGEGNQIFEGWVTIGHEVRSFEPCFRKEALWLMGISPALNEIIAAYRRTLPNAKTYRSLFMVLAGELVGPPADGFGADYEAAFLATQLLRVTPILRSIAGTYRLRKV